MSRPSADEGFLRIYDGYHARVLSYCLRRASTEDAKDATAEVFLIAWRRMGDLPGADRDLAWLYGTARKVLANQRRSRSRLANLTSALQLNSASSPSIVSTEPAMTVVRREQDREVLDAIERLRPLDREVIRLALWEELPQKEIGLALGCSDRAVTMRLHRALSRLRREIRDRPERTRTPGLFHEMETRDG